MTEILNQFWNEEQIKFIEDFIKSEFEYILVEKEFELEIVEFKEYLDGMPYKNEILIERYEFAIETNRIYVELTFENYIELVYDGDIFKAFQGHITDHLIQEWWSYIKHLYIGEDDEEWFKEWINKDDIDDDIITYLDSHTTEQILDLVGYEYELPMLK
jgi:hypothetical protein